MNGTSVVLYANTGTPGTPIWTQVGSQRDAKIAEDVAIIDASSKDQAQRRVIGGRYSSSFTLQQLYTPTDAAYQALVTSFRTRAVILVQVYESGVLTAQANVLIAKIDKDFPDQKEALATFTCEIDGPWTTFATF